jgi:hypothetical protein
MFNQHGPDQSFSGEDDENPYSHLNEFEQTCACLRIVGMSDETLHWKLFLFSLTKRDKCWYKQTIGSRKRLGSLMLYLLLAFLSHL